MRQIIDPEQVLALDLPRSKRLTDIVVSGLLAEAGVEVRSLAPGSHQYLIDKAEKTVGTNVLYEKRDESLGKYAGTLVVDTHPAHRPLVGRNDLLTAARVVHESDCDPQALLYDRHADEPAKVMLFGSDAVALEPRRADPNMTSTLTITTYAE